MQIVESWEDHNANVYAIVKYSKEERQEFKNKEYEAMWMDETTEKHPQLNSFAGTVGYRIAEFDTVCQRQLESNMATIRNAHGDGTPGGCGVWLGLR